MKVTFLLNGLGTGGAQRSIAEMLPLMSDHGLEPAFVCLDHKDEGVEQSVAAAGYDVEVLRSVSTVRRVAELRGLMLRWRPRLLTTTLFEADILGRLAAAGTGIPVLTSLVNTPYNEARQADPNVRRLRLAAARALDAATARHLTTHFHAVTHAVKQDAVVTLGIEPDRVTVVERGRDTSRLGKRTQERRRRVRNDLGVREAAPLLVTAGRQEYQKDHSSLLRAIVEVAREFPDVQLVVAGRSGRASQELGRLHRHLALEDRVHFLGHREDVPDLLAAADLFVFPSLYEGIGGAVIEAMGLGLPVVASDIPSLREVVEAGGNALLVPPRDPRALADAICAVLRDGERARRFGCRSREIFEERFTLERSAARMVELLRWVAEERRQPRKNGRGRRVAA